MTLEKRIELLELKIEELQKAKVVIPWGEGLSDVGLFPLLNPYPLTIVDKDYFVAR